MLINERYWAIEEEFLAGFLKNTAGLLTPRTHLPEVQYHAAENSYSRNELAWYFGIKTEQVKGGLVAVIPMVGVLSPEWSWEGTNTRWLATQIRIADENVDVRAIVLDTSSPGGTVSGTMALANAVKMTTKKTLAYVQHMAASAAVWSIANCDEIWIESATTTGMGSIGTMLTVMSFAEQLKKDGIDVRVLRSAGSEDKALLNPLEEINEEALQEQQTLIDAMRVEFLDDVRAARPQVPADITGKMYYGKDAIKIGLADKVGSLTDTIKRAFYLSTI